MMKFHRLFFLGAVAFNILWASWLRVGTKKHLAVPKNIGGDRAKGYVLSISRKKEPSQASHFFGDWYNGGPFYLFIFSLSI